MRLSTLLHPISSGINRTLLLFAFFAVHWLSTLDTVQARDNLGWGNAAQVCATPRVGEDSPDLKLGAQKQIIKTGFYRIGRAPNPQGLFLGVSDDDLTTVSMTPAAQSTPAEWLVTVVGTDLHQISICNKGQPRCLVLGPDNQPLLGECAYDAYGTQAWWTVGIVKGPGAGGWELGSDGLGRLECLTQSDKDGSQLAITTCEPSGAPSSSWKLEPVSNSMPSSHSAHASDLERVSYNCTSGTHVFTSYDSKRDQMQVQYKDQTHILTPVISGSGAKFGGPNLKWGWWTKAKEGFVFAYEENGDEGGILDRCQEISAAAVTASPSIPTRRWSAQGTDDHIRLADCTDCGDDVGIIVACQGAGQPALVSVNWAASERDQSSDFLSFEIKGMRYQRDVISTTSGMVGFTPQFLLQHDDPLIDALKNGRSAHITYGDITTQIGLSGSAFAFDIFKAHCSWQSAAPQSSSAALWFEEKYLDDQSSQTTHALIYGIPQTDALNFVSACQPGNPTFDLRLLVETGGQPEGNPYTVHFKSGALDKSYKGKIFASSDEYNGVRIPLAANDPLWMAIAANDTLTLTPQLGSAITLNNPSTSNIIPNWLASCQGS